MWACVCECTSKAMVPVLGALVAAKSGGVVVMCGGDCE